MSQPLWMVHAWRELGETERAGRDANPRIRALFRDAGHSEVASDEIAWCAAFVSAMLERSGARSTRSLLARSYLSWGGPLDEPRLGAIAVLSRGSDTTQGHVGFYLGETEASVFILGGNQSNAVSVASFPKSRVLALRWPNEKRVGAGLPQPDFDGALAHVLEMEGGFTDDPYDPGGPTNLGITLGEYAAWRATRLDASNRAELVADLKRLSIEAARAIYQRRYWTPARCDVLPAPLALMHFDAAVNHGHGAASRMLQEAVGADVDGEIGPETIAAAARASLSRAIDDYAALRRKRYRALPTFSRFGRGWLTRVDRTLARAKALTTAPSFPNATSKGESMTDKTNDAQAEPKWWGESMTIWGTLITTLSTVVPIVSSLVGVDISSGLVEQVGNDVTNVIQAVTAFTGTLMTIYGRIRARQPLARRSISIRL